MRVETSLPAFERPPREPPGANRHLYDKVYAEAVDRYVVNRAIAIQHLKEIINRRGSTAELQKPAQTFVLVRNDMRATLNEFATNLGYETDSLENTLKTLEKNPGEPGIADRLQQNVLALLSKWPARSAAIQSSLKKILNDLGVEGVLSGTIQANE